jgi:HAD superfamily hydrolase (TIGR01509 family)
MLRAILFDFDGVILDSEDLHYEAFRRVFEEEGVPITREVYYRNCLGFNDAECIRWGLGRTEKLREPGGLEELTRKKSVYFDGLLENQMRFFPGVCDFIRAAARKYPLAVASMALRREIEFTLKKAGLSDLFCVIVSGEEVEKTKPDPEAYQKALSGLNAHLSLEPAQWIRASECLVIEDSAAGIGSAKAAGMRVLGLAHTEDSARLQEADRVLPSLEGVTLEDVEPLFGG